MAKQWEYAHIHPHGETAVTVFTPRRKTEHVGNAVTGQLANKDQVDIVYQFVLELARDGWELDHVSGANGTYVWLKRAVV